MRYGDGGGVNQAARERRELVRHRAAAMFAAGMHPLDVAAALEVSEKSGYQWHRAWKTGGTQALASKGPPGPDRTLSDTQIQRLQAVLERGALAAGYDDAVDIGPGGRVDPYPVSLQGEPADGVGVAAAHGMEPATTQASGVGA